MTAGLEAQMVLVPVVLALVINEVLRWLVRSFLKKTVGTTYVTEEQCARCREKCRAELEKKNKESHLLLLEALESLREMRGILLVVAVRAGVDASDLKELTK